MTVDSRGCNPTKETGFLLRSCSNVNKGIFGGGGRVYLTYLQPERLSVNPPLQLIENGARSQFLPTVRDATCVFFVKNPVSQSPCVQNYVD